MKKTLLYLILLLINLFFLKAESEIDINEKLPLIQSIGNSGNEFYFTIPPSYEEKPSQSTVKVFVTTSTITNVKVEIKSQGFFLEKTTIPNGVISFEIPIEKAIPLKYNPKGEQGIDAILYEQAGIYVKSDYPITVYVIFNSYNISEGFLALPKECIGKEYIVATYNDMGWNGSLYYLPFAAITAVYDKTTFEIQLGGNSSSQFRDQDGKIVTPGQKFKQFYLDKGDVFIFSSNGPFQDITGSKIKADKPFSLVSAHYCMNVPLQNQWCNYAIEMQSPTSTWGKNYLIPKYTTRRFNGIVRVFAKENNTNVYRDGEFWFNIPKSGGIEGIGWQEQRVWGRNDDFGKELRPKNAAITADKPIQIMYYNPGSQEDAGLITQESNDPFMMNMVPLELFPNEITFNTPITDDESRFNKNLINIIFELDNSFLVPDHYEFGEFKNGKYFWTKLKTLIDNKMDSFQFKIEGKTFASFQYELEREGNYKIRSTNSNAKIMVYGIGINTSEMYAYPLYNSYKEVFSLDSLAPNPTWELTNQGNVENGKVTDLPNPDFLKIRTNLNIIRMNTLNSYNYKFSHNPIIVGSDSISNWSLEIIDTTKEARAEIYFSDRAGNDTTIVIEYSKSDADVKLQIEYEDFICENIEYVYTIEDRDFYQFNWEILGDFTIISSTKNERVIKWNSAQNAKIKVERTNTKTNKTENIEIDITVKSKPIVENSGILGACSYDTITVEFAPFPNYSDVRYDLRDINGNKIFYKSLLSNLEIFKFIPEVSGELKLYVTANNGTNCETTEIINVTSGINYPKVNLTFSDNMLIADIKDAEMYYWHLEDVIIDATTIPEYQPKQKGNYYVSIIHPNSKCNSPISNSIFVSKLGVNDDISENIQFLGYENKTIKLKILDNELFSNILKLSDLISLIDLNGKGYELDINMSNDFIDLKLNEELLSGTYFIKFNNKNYYNKSSSFKFIINK